VDLLRLVFMYGPAHLSLRGTAAMADDAGIAALSDKGVLGRLRKAGNWLEHLLQRLLAEKRGRSLGADEGALELALVDGSVICAPTTKGADWRLHGRFDPGQGCFGDLVLSEGHVSEQVGRTQIDPARTTIQDRGYARVRDFVAILGAGGNFITRIGWRSLRLLGADRQAINVLALLPQDDQPSEQTVYVKGVTAPLRLVIQRLPVAKADQQRKRVSRKSGKSGHKLDPRTSVAAGYMMLITSLPQEVQPGERIVFQYRNRWQIEIAFKRLKTIGGIDKLPASDPALARTWLLAHLIAAVITDEIANEIVGFSPSAACSATLPDARPAID
jgi:hypothetical protein